MDRYRGYYYSRPIETPLYPTMDTSFHDYQESGNWPLPLILLSAFGVATTATALSVMTRSSFWLGLVTALGLFGVKLYFLLRFRSQPRYEQTEASRRDKVFGYVILAVILIVLSAFGLYGSGDVNGADATSQGQVINTEGSFLSFLQATLSKDTWALVCWVAAASIEIIIFFVSRNRREYEQRVRVSRAMYDRG